MIPAWVPLALPLLAMAALAYLLVRGLARTAATADRQERHEAREVARTVGPAGERGIDRLSLAELGSVGIHSGPGHGDLLQPALREARLALRDAEARLASIEDQRVVDERRTGPADRRAVSRPWSEESAGRRQSDALRREVLAAREVLREAETGLAAVERRRAAGDA